jgi:hypothetical protein
MSLPRRAPDEYPRSVTSFKENPHGTEELFAGAA